ncbi:peptidoglycan-binding protein [Streptomyces sp. NPDC088921]|uniref:peptidoglycan-binding protein n=1 Tax=unclassified Streptomyces TaxID=2593676 RepID=UPI003425389F
MTAFRFPLVTSYSKAMREGEEVHIPRKDLTHLVPWMPIEAMGHRLIEEGCSAYPGNRPDYQWSDADQASCPKWQRKVGFSDKDADGIPGRSSRDRLHVSAVLTE